MCMKYVTKYALKGLDYAFVEVLQERGPVVNFDEFRLLRLARYITAQEAFMALWGYPLVHTKTKVCPKSYMFFSQFLFLYVRLRFYSFTRKTDSGLYCPNIKALKLQNLSKIESERAFLLEKRLLLHISR